MILITEFMDEDAVEWLSERFETVYRPELADDQSQIPALMGGVRALIVRNRTKVTAELLQASPNLICVGRLGVGLDNIDQPACADQGVTVYPAFGANNLSVAEYVVTSALVLLRGAYLSKSRMVAGEWPRQACSGREVAGKTLGLVGYGAIARHTAGMARGLGMDVVAYDPFLTDGDPAWGATENLSLEDVLRRSDVVSLHTPLTPETRHMINASRLALMKPDAVLINAARGGVVDEGALAAALADGRLGGAALDVFEVEPLTAQGAAKFKGLENILLTPHIAGVTEESNVRVSTLIAQKVSEHLSN